MVNGPPCPSCGWTLRWVPEQNAWGCDRCRTMHPAQPAVPQAPQPQAAWARGPAAAAPASSLAVPAITPAGGSFGGSAASSSPVARSPSQPPGVYAAPQQQQRAHSPSQQAFQQARPHSSSQPNHVYGQQPAPNAQPPNPYAPQPYVQQAAVSHAGGSYPGTHPASQPGQPGQPGQPAPQAHPNPQQPNGYQNPQQQAGAQQGPRAGSQAGSPPAYGPGGYPIHSREPDSMLAPEPPPPPKKSKRGLVIGLVAVGAIGAGVAVAVAMSGGKGSKGGADSKEVVTADTLAALTKGDAAALVAMMPPQRESDFTDCTEVGAKDYDAAKMLEKLTERMTKAVNKAKGLDVELVKLGDAKTTKMEKGKEVEHGCILKTELAIHDHELLVKVKKGGFAKERKLRIMLIEIEGRWYLANPPQIERPGDCAIAAKTSIKNNDAKWKKSSLGDAAKARLEKAMTQHCSEDGWSDEAVTCIEDAGSDGSDKACAKSLTAPQLDKLTKKLEQIVLEDVKSREVPTIAETPPPGIDPTANPTAGSGSGSGSGSASEGPEQLPPICDDFKAEIEKLEGCRRVKDDMKKGLRATYETMVDGWKRITKMNDVQRTSFEGICKKGVENVVDLRKTLCR